MTKQINQSKRKNPDATIANISESLNKAKKETKKMSTKKTVIVTVVLTLIIAGALAAQALFFYNLGVKNTDDTNRTINAKAEALVGQLKHQQ